MSEQEPACMKPPRESGLIVPIESALAKVPAGSSSALSEIINRSVVHIQTSKSLELLQHSVKQELTAGRVDGEEQEFEIAPGVKIVMCWIPPGEFLMGSPEYEEYRRGDEIQHRVRITQGFWLAKTQTTQAQWQAVMGSNPSDFKGFNLPVESVSWNDISQPKGFLERVNRHADAGGIFTLPTEAQWEYACRAGTTTALNNGRNLTGYEGCPNLDEVAWYGENSGETTHPVGQKKANAWGLHDMHGNVWEWCKDWHEDYPDEPQIDPRGPDSGSDRVLRGGSWYDNADYCRAAYRYYYDPGYDDSYYGGFRIARSSVPQ